MNDQRSHSFVLSFFFHYGCDMLYDRVRSTMNAILAFTEELISS